MRFNYTISVLSAISTVLILQGCTSTYYKTTAVSVIADSPKRKESSRAIVYSDDRDVGYDVDYTNYDLKIEEKPKAIRFSLPLAKIGVRIKKTLTYNYHHPSPTFSSTDNNEWMMIFSNLSQMQEKQDIHEDVKKLQITAKKLQSNRQKQAEEVEGFLDQVNTSRIAFESIVNAIKGRSIKKVGLYNETGRSYEIREFDPEKNRGELFGIPQKNPNKVLGDRDLAKELESVVGSMGKGFLREVKTMTNPSTASPIPIRSTPKVMRIYIAPWVDKSGSFHSGGFIFTQIEKEKWNLASAAR